MTLAASVRDFCLRHGKKHIWIALSGGLDSRVLLDLCHTIRSDVPCLFRVIHVHHGLSPQADQWVEQCAAVCLEYDVEFNLAHAHLKNKLGDSLEESARKARYDLFASFLAADDLLLTAHHQDDQAETLLLQLLRGSGPKGLSAMPALKPFATGFHGRPLLNFSRQQLVSYAEERQLSWVEDESNDDCALTRNFIRHDVMPVFKRRWPTVESTLARSAQHCAEAQSLLDEVANERLATVQGVASRTLSVSKLLSYSESWQRLLLRSWIIQSGFSLPPSTKLISIQKTILRSAQDKMPCVRWRGAEMRRYRDDIHLISEVLCVPEVGQGLRLEMSDVTIRNRMPGESVEVLARGRVSLKNLFQEWQVPTWERGNLPLLFCGNKLIQVPGYFKDPAYFL